MSNQLGQGVSENLRPELVVAILAPMNLAQRYFSSLAELSKDNGLIGQMLRNYPDEILRAADKWGEQDREYQAPNYVDLIGPASYRLPGW